jgi:hypothetical protein
MFTLGTHFPFYDLEEKRIATKVDEKRKYFMRRKEKENIQMQGRVPETYDDCLHSVLVVSVTTKDRI